MKAGKTLIIAILLITLLIPMKTTFAFTFSFR